MKTNVFFNIAFRIILLFGTAILMTFVSEQLHSFLGDKTHVCPSDYCYHGDLNNDGYDWGTRHYWYFWMCVTLFILALINFVISIVELVKKEYPNL